MIVHVFKRGIWRVRQSGWLGYLALAMTALTVLEIVSQVTGLSIFGPVAPFKWVLNVAGTAATWYAWSALSSARQRLENLAQTARRITQRESGRGNAYRDPMGVIEGSLQVMEKEIQSTVVQLGELAEANRKLAADAWHMAAVEERTRLARDLHDTVTQQLFSLSMRAGALRTMVATGLSADQIAARLLELEDIATTAHDQTRELILHLRHTTLESQGIGHALYAYVQSIASRESWTLHPQIDQELRLSTELSECLFRVAQEIINNIVKHARTSVIHAALVRTSDGVALRIRDEGVGFSTRKKHRTSSIGLMGIQERVSSLGGNVRVLSTPGAGTEVSAFVPLPIGGISDDTGSPRG